MAISLKTLQQNYNQYVYSDTGPTHEYFNMGLFNEYTPNNTQPRTLKFNQIKQAPIIDKCDDYYLSIIRWNLQSNLPVLIPDIQIKPNKEAFTGLTDYELAFFYNTETSTQLQNTFGLVGADGTNYLGIYKNGEFGDLKKVLINFPPDNAQSCDYDNFNNGLTPNSGGSIYIISGGIIKVFDKIKATPLATFTPAVGSSYKFLSANKTTGDFYVGIVNNSNDLIEYYEFTRTGPTAWTIGVSPYTSQFNKNNVNGISYVAGTLNELSGIQSTPDALFGVTGGNAYAIEAIDTQLTNSPTLICPLAHVPGYYFAVDNNFHTYAIIDPVISPPQSMFEVQTSPGVKYVYTKQALVGGLYGIGTSQLFYQWNASDYPNGPASNTWSEFGEFGLTSSLSPTILSVDSNNFDNKVLAVGSDNNLYISRNPIAPYEFCSMNANPSNPSQVQTNLIGFDFTANPYVVDSNLPFNGQNLVSFNGCFKHTEKYFYLESTTLIIYSGYTSAILNTYPNLDTVMSRLTYLPQSSNFAYFNIATGNVIIRECSNPNIIVDTFSIPSDEVISICEIDATHIAVATLTLLGVYSIDIYVYGNVNPINTIVVTSTGVSDITFNKDDITNGAGKLFYLDQSSISGIGVCGTRLFSITFTDATYTVANTPSLLYTANTGRFSSYIQCKPENGTVCLLEYDTPDNGFYNNRVMKFFYQSASYNPANILSYSYIYNNVSNQVIKPNKTGMWMNHSTMSTHLFTQVNSNIQVVSACCSRQIQNYIYAVGTNNRIYEGLCIGNSVNLSIVNLTPNTYNYVSCRSTSNPSTLENVIQQWTATGPSSSIIGITSSQLVTPNPSPSSLYNDGAHLYALYSNIDNTTFINKRNPATLAEVTLNNLGNLNVLNGLIGYDSNNNILLSNVINGVNSLTSVNQFSLQIQNNYVDPNTDYGTTTMLTYPFNYSETVTSYTQLGDTTTLVFIPETVNVNLETFLDYPRNKEELFENPYFYIKYVDTFCRMFNNAVRDAWQTTSGTWAKLPYIQWDSALSKIVFYQPTSSPTGTPTPVGANFYISVNQPLYNLLNTFRFKYYPTEAGNGALYPETAECRYLLDTNILFDGTVQVGGEYATYLQQISSVQTWTPIQSWVFSSTIIPIESQLTGQPQNLNNVDPTTSGNIYKQQAITKVLTDFIVPLNTGVEATNQNVFYTPAGEYRLVDLLGGSSLNQLSLEIKWRDKYGVDHDMYLDAGASANLLVLLRKKLYNSKM